MHIINAMANLGKSLQHWLNEHATMDLPNASTEAKMVPLNSYSHYMMETSLKVYSYLQIIEELCVYPLKQGVLLSVLFLSDRTTRIFKKFIG